MLSAFLVRYYVPVEGRARRRSCCRSRRQTGTRCGSSCRTPSGPCRSAAPPHRWLDLADQNARHLLESLRIESFETEERAEDPVYALGRDLGLSVVPRSLVCVDISTTRGGTPWARWCGSRRAARRRASTASSRSRALGQQDDFAAIHEVVTRYLTRRRDEAHAAARPDGDRRRQGPAGRGAGRAAEALGLGAIPIVSLAKREEEVFLPGRAETAPAVAAEPVAPAAAAGARRGPPLRPGVQPPAAHHGATITSELLEHSGCRAEAAAPAAGALRQPGRRADAHRWRSSPPCRASRRRLRRAGARRT